MDKDYEEQHILKFYGYFYDPNDICFYLCMEAFENAKLLEKDMKKYDEYESLVITRQITRAVSFLAKEEIWLKNFSFDYIFVNSQLEIKIWDLGLIDGIVRIWNGFLNKLPMYAAPEMFTSSEEYYNKNESWSIGVILYRLLYKELPFKTKPIKMKKKKFIKEITNLGGRISEFGLSEIEKTHEIKDCWSNVFKHTLTNREDRMSSE